MDVVTPSRCQRRKLADIRTCRRWSQLRALVGKQSNATVTLLVAVRVTRFGETRPQSNTLRVFGSTTRVTRVSLTDMHNINNPDLQVERLVLLSYKSNLFYQGHTVLRSSTIRCQYFFACSDFHRKQRTVTYDTRGHCKDTRGHHASNTCTPHKLDGYSCCLTGTTLPPVLGVRQRCSRCRNWPVPYESYCRTPSAWARSMEKIW